MLDVSQAHSFLVAAVVAFRCWVAGSRAQPYFFHILGLETGNGTNIYFFYYVIISFPCTHSSAWT